MQAAWGAENKAPTPIRTGELYGEQGRWLVNNTETVPDVFTRADPGVRGADDPNTKFYVPQRHPSANIQHHTHHKQPAQVDLQPNGLHLGVKAHPDQMTMNDHDHALVWPPPKGEEHLHAKFMDERIFNDPKLRAPEVNGIMVGYKGHVPRARDKVGQAPLGHIVAARSEAGFPAPEETNPSYLPAYGAQTSHQMEGEHPLYVSEAMAHGKSALMESGGTDSNPRPNRSVDGNGYIPRFAGHKPAAYEHIGGSVYGSSSKGYQSVPESTFEYKTIHGTFKRHPSENLELPRHGRAPM
eukprot:CAMPEP_0174707038 /NCGR_PEP_ID=MMETSP1094-20130205/9666_1 /TAXON_ID=156173 /ORGANISM="Chrysochromulina brevifilum, Strain UTEX LB 985" /LENGTH=296 /DNA_ID=CAMNT_0015905373 /DNA_START=43 /DNA_END=933 /DNA_ORIENTATION=+